jgi:hypothetical protein
MTNTSIENRSAARYSAALVPSIAAVRISPHGADATLLNISTRGVLVECTSRFRLGTAVTVVFEGTFSPSSVAGRVARISVSTMSANGVLRYHVGVEFGAPIALPIGVGAPAGGAAAQRPQPVASAQPAASAQPGASSLPAQTTLANRW